MPMDKSYADITSEINRGIMKLRQSVPDAMAGFSALSKGALKAGALSELQRVPDDQRQDVHVQRQQAGVHQGHQRRHVSDR
jgi:hypothetical protein